MTATHIAEVAAYIQRWGGHLDRYFGHRMDPAGKRLFVMGSGWGSEALWALKRGAIEVVGVDPVRDGREALDLALELQGLSHLRDRVTLLKATTMTVPDVGTFDLLMSNNVMEHVFDLSANLSALRPLMPGKGARFVVFADPLYFSSLGHHLPIGPWEHLTLSQSDIQARVGRNQWRDYREGLNGMTITDFLSAVREAGMVLTELSLIPDARMDGFEAQANRLPPGLKPMDLCLEGVSCTLAFPENL